MPYQLTKGTLIYLLFAEALKYQKVTNIVSLSGWGVSCIIGMLLFPAAEKTVLSQKEVNQMHPQLWQWKDFDLEST